MDSTSCHHAAQVKADRSIRSLSLLTALMAISERRTTDQMCPGSNSTEGAKDIADSCGCMLMGALNLPDGA